MELGSQIKQLRLRKGITQEEMAQYFGSTAEPFPDWKRKSNRKMSRSLRTAHSFEKGRESQQ